MVSLFINIAFTLKNINEHIQETLRKHAYSSILKISQSKTENFQINDSDIFHISAQNLDYGYSLEPPRRGGSNEYPLSVFDLKFNKKILPL